MTLKIGILIIGLPLIFSKCVPKDYVYTYVSADSESGQVKAIPFTGNDFRFNCNLSWDTVIVNKEKAVPVLLTLIINGQHQYWPKGLRFELYYNDQRIKLSDSVKFNVTTVLDNRVSYFRAVKNTINIPELLLKLKLEEQIPDSVSYFSIAGSYKTCAVANKTNPDNLKITIKAFWDKGSDSKQMNYILKKVEKQDYHLPVRPFG